MNARLHATLAWSYLVVPVLLAWVVIGFILGFAMTGHR